MKSRFAAPALGLGLAAPLLGAGHGARAQAYTFTTLDDTPGYYGGTESSAINAQGQVAGVAGNVAGAHGFVYTPSPGGGTFSHFDAPGASGFYPNGTHFSGINDSGLVVGDYNDSQSVDHGFTLAPGPGGDYGQGTLTLFSDPSASGGMGGDTVPRGLNDLGQIVGDNIDSNDGYHGFVYTPGTGFAPLDDPAARVNSTFPVAINARGQVIGSYQVAEYVDHGFLYTPGVGFVTLDDPLAVHGTDAEGLNDQGQVVGYYTDRQYVSHGFVYTPGAGFVNFDDPLGTEGTRAAGITDAGLIVGSYRDALGDDHAFFAAAPEPPQTAVLGLGSLALACLALKAHRRKTNAA